MVSGKLATNYQDQITKTLAERIANPDLAVHEVKALQALQDIWTNADLSKKDREAPHIKDTESPFFYGVNS